MGDPYWASVVLAMHMDGVNASTVFTDLKGHVVSAFGNAQISTAQSKFGGASALFDGTGDYLSIADTTLLGSAAFTAECWVYFNSVSIEQIIWSQYGGGSLAGRCGLEITSAGKPSFFINGLPAGNRTLAHTTSFVVNTWNHVAVVRNAASEITLYLNGVGSNPAQVYGAPAAENLVVGSLGSVGSLQINGYIDDLRITKGVARYTSNFTPPAAAFPNAPAMIAGTVKDSANAFAPRAVRAYRKSDGALAGAVTSHATTGAFSVPALDASLHYAIAHDTDADPLWSSVVLATHFDSDSVIDPYMSSVVLGLHMEGANASTVFQDVTGKNVTAAGNAQHSTAQARFGGSSALFDGTGDYLTVPDSAAWAFGTGDFTIEAWVYRSVVGATHRIVAQRVSTDINNLVTFGIRSDDKLAMAAYNGGTVVTSLVSVATIPAATWTHVAATRSAGVVKLWVGGANADTVTANLTSAYPDLTTPLIIGRGYSDTDGENFNGYIDDLRVTSVARYTANFTLPTVPFSSFKDLTGKDVLVNGGPSVNTTTKKYGDASMYFDGTGDYLSVPANGELAFGSGDFTIELWANLSNTTACGIVSMGTGAAQILLYSNAGNMLFYASSAGTWDVASAAVIKAAFTTSQWCHLAVCRAGNTIYLFADGIRTKAIAVGSIALASPIQENRIGKDSGGSGFMTGYIDDLRITKGAARYVADFTPPERAFAGAMTAGTANALIYDDLTPV